MESAERVVSDVMQREVVTLEVTDRLDLADDIMKLGRVRHMPVIREGRVVGIVSQRDLMAASLSKALDFDPQQRRTFMRSVDVAEVMSGEVVSVGPGSPLREAAELMVRRKLGCLPVLGQDGALLGLLTETDLLRAAYLEGEMFEGEILEIHEEKEKQAMADVGDKLEQEWKALQRSRDELRVQIHLGRAEAKEQWERIEHRYQEAESKLKSIARESEAPLREVRAAAKLLLQEIREGYRQIRSAL